jgi:hypothetical protein
MRFVAPALLPENSPNYKSLSNQNSSTLSPRWALLFHFFRSKKAKCLVLIRNVRADENGKPKEPEMIRLLSSLRYECYKVSSDELLPANACRVPKVFARNLCQIFKTIVSVRSSNGSPKAHDAGRICFPRKLQCQLETQIVKPSSTESTSRISRRRKTRIDFEDYFKGWSSATA